MLGDLQRYAQRYGVPFVMNPYFPTNTLTLMRGAAGYQIRRPDVFADYVEVVFRAMWVTSCNLDDSAELAKTIAGAGLDVSEFVTMIGATEIKDALAATTAEAVARGVFGAPTFFVGDQMFFGQDRLDFVRAALVKG